MSIFDDYTKRVKNTGDSIANSLGNSTKTSISQSFKDSPFYKIVDIYHNGLANKYGVRIVETNNYLIRELLFLPDTKIKRGSIAEFNNYKWLVMDFNDNDLFAKARAKQCNNSITLTSNSGESVIIGYDELGRPVYDDVENEKIIIPCICDTVVQNDDTERAVNLPQEQMLVIIPYTEHEDLDYDKELILYGSHFKIIGIDDTESIDKVGLRRLTLERVAD
ncbi:hypothetical protein [Priestia megaterium]|uniref:hypothetical protein n=1 Tax=Priestia megaterium TaxID=1404 RepID=UPI00112BF1E7|nr:hypothetical protein [Priestia megaterium]TPF17935.1 hypothetical protein CBE78_01555 [Priestia megaterium]TPF22043.1 hypothetical protein CBE79_04060 [Priestia megaterium]